MPHTEIQTRQEIIDKQLEKAGWNISDRTQVIEEFTIHVNTKSVFKETPASYPNQQFSDYVLLGKDGKPLAVIEAKKTSLSLSFQ